MAILIGITVPTCFFSASAGEFNGALTNINITDAQSINKPPNASFIYDQNDKTFLFDGSGSTDSDGEITKYIWDFGDGSTGTGISVTHSYWNSGNYNVSLTVLDNKYGVSITNKNISTNKPSKSIMYDRFTEADTSLFTTFSGKLSINGDKLTSSKNMWTFTRHNTDLGKADHFIEIKYEGTSDNVDGAFPACRYSDANNYVYMRKANGTTYALYKNIAGTLSVISSSTMKNIQGTLRLECKGDTVEWFTDGQSNGTFNISNIPKSNFVGIIFNRSNNSPEINVVHLEANAL